MSAGRPPMFETPEELEDKIQAYVEHCTSKREPSFDGGFIMTDGQPLTITGLAYFLGFESRQSFYDYEQNKEFSYTIKRARLMIESSYERALSGKNAAGPIFALKNFGWKDTQDITHNIPKGVLNIDPIADDPTHDGAKKDSET